MNKHLPAFTLLILFFTACGSGSSAMEAGESAAADSTTVQVASVNEDQEATSTPQATNSSSPDSSSPEDEVLETDAPQTGSTEAVPTPTTVSPGTVPASTQPPSVGAPLPPGPLSDDPDSTADGGLVVVWSGQRSVLEQAAATVGGELIDASDQLDFFLVVFEDASRQELDDARDQLRAAGFDARLDIVSKDPTTGG